MFDIVSPGFFSTNSSIRQDPYENLLIVLIKCSFISTIVLEKLERFRG